MSWIVAILVGAIVGWIASMTMGDREGLLDKILIGMVGSVLAKWLLADLMGIGGAASAWAGSSGGCWGLWSSSGCSEPWASWARRARGTFRGRPWAPLGQARGA